MLLDEGWSSHLHTPNLIVWIYWFANSFTLPSIFNFATRQTATRNAAEFVKRKYASTMTVCNFQAFLKKKNKIYRMTWWHIVLKLLKCITFNTCWVISLLPVMFHKKCILTGLTSVKIYLSDTFKWLKCIVSELTQHTLIQVYIHNTKKKLNIKLKQKNPRKPCNSYVTVVLRDITLSYSTTNNIQIFQVFSNLDRWLSRFYLINCPNIKKEKPSVFSPWLHMLIFPWLCSWEDF